jgi:regulation of enolase protein 1 (concanavalin A-like superfamily)
LITANYLLPFEATLAFDPKPAHGANHVTQLPILKWTAGTRAATHDVYFSDDANAVVNADTTTVGVYRGRQALAMTSFAPGSLEWNKTYYWRVDEVNNLDPYSPWRGSIWSFTTSDCLIVDDFEDYSDLSPHRIFQTWIDSFGFNDPAPGNPGNGTGSTVGYVSPDFLTGEHFIETTDVHGGSQSMPFGYDNSGAGGTLPYSEAERVFAVPQNWTVQGIQVLTLWYHGMAGSTGGISFDTATQTYTMSGSGADIGGTSDQFHYAYKQLNGNGSITARVVSVTQTHDWAKAGVMIRNTLDADSPYAMVVATPHNRVSFQRRVDAGDSSQDTSSAVNSTPLPHWVRLTRQGNLFRAEHSADGSNWQPVTGASPDDPSSMSILMDPNVYIGLAVTSRSANLTCEAKFTNVGATGDIRPAGLFVTSDDVGIAGNDAEQLYVAVEDSAGRLAVANHPDGPTARTVLVAWRSRTIRMVRLRCRLRIGLRG